MSVRSAGRGSAAARSIRLALRSLSTVATKSASLPRRVLRWRGSRRRNSASIPAAITPIPLIAPPSPAHRRAASTTFLLEPQPKLMNGKGLAPEPVDEPVVVVPGHARDQQRVDRPPGNDDQVAEKADQHEVQQP